MDIKETFPKSGHVHEVCKEWLVREDSALAYRLQSQEINEFYQGNKFRNAVVRQDFPTALNEQIKEKETAEQEAARYYKLLKEQEEADKCLAEKLANKLEKDQQMHLTKQIEESEIIAKQMQDIYVNLSANDGILRPIPISSSNSFSLSNGAASIDNDNNDNQQERCSSLDFSDNLICDRFEKLHCRLTKPTDINDMNEHEYERYFDVANNIRNADIQEDTSSVGAHQQQKDCSFGYGRSPQQNELTHLKSGYNIDRSKEIWPQVAPSSASRKHSKSGGKHCHRNGSEISSLNLNIPSPNDLDLSPEDFAELNKKLEQEKNDEELARHLQKEEQRRNLSQEEKDRLLAIEAQDKELAMMLQEREKLKAKRAKEKARLKKLQAKELAENSKFPIVNEPYSNPRDFIADSQLLKLHHPIPQKPHNFSPPSGNFDSININDHDNSNNNNEDIYTLPVDNSNNHEMDLSSIEKMNTSTTSKTSSLSSPSSISQVAKHHQQIGTESFSPKPPYMPIHDIGSNLSSDGGKKKKSKDKCTHQ